MLKVTTDFKHSYPVSENLLDHKFIGNALDPDIGFNLDQNHYKLVISYCGVGFSRQKEHWMSFELSETMKAKDNTIAAFEMTVKNRHVI